jgi:hypothetical protein
MFPWLPCIHLKLIPRRIHFIDDKARLFDQAMLISGFSIITWLTNNARGLVSTYLHMLVLYVYISNVHIKLCIYFILWILCN